MRRAGCVLLVDGCVVAIAGAERDHRAAERGAKTERPNERQFIDVQVARSDQMDPPNGRVLAGD